MTSGPMRAGALPPERQSDPQVIARVALAADMNIAWDPSIALMLRSGTASMESQRNDDGSRTVTIRARKSLTVADIPAGRSAASLFIAADPLDSGMSALWFRDASGDAQWCRWAAASGDSPASTALWEHLAATLPTVEH